MTLVISRFWIAFAAGTPLGPAWAKKDKQIALAGEVDLTLAEAESLPLSTWAAMPRARRQAVEVALYGVALSDGLLAGERRP